MQAYKTKAKRVSGTRYREVYDEAFILYEKIKKRTKRRPYIRSVYFQKQKIFIDLFWQHLHDKNWRDRARRIRFFPAAVELLKYTTNQPQSKDNPNHSNETLHRFTGTTADGYLFYVQVRENKRNSTKSLYSVFPEQKEAKTRK